MWILFLCAILLTFSSPGEGSNSYSLNDYDRIARDEVIAESFLSEFGKKERERGDLFDALTSLYLPSVQNVSNSCRRDLERIHGAFSNPLLLLRNPWALKLFDSWGKFEDGILQGNNRLLGFFEECLAIQSPTGINGGSSVKGQYCLLKYRKKANGTDERMPQVLIPLGFGSLLSTYSSCMPATCTSQELMDSVNVALQSTNLAVHDVQCQTDEKRELDGSQIFGICFFSIFFVLLSVASIFDFFTAGISNSRLRKRFGVLLAFSVPENISVIMKVDTSPSPAVISCIHGLRVLSISWIIWCHQYLFTAGMVSNSFHITPLTQHFMIQFVAGGDKAVDTFFTISGFLVAYNMFKALKKNPKFPAAMYYIHRVIRLLPPIGIACVFFACISDLLVRGPYLYDYVKIYTAGCRRSWWIDLTFSSNIMARVQSNIPEKRGQSSSCIPQSWYTAVDTQLYILLPLILIPLYFRGRKGLAWIFFWIFVSCLIPAVIIGVFDLYPMLMLTLNVTRYVEFLFKFYYMPWCRASPYLVGTLAGYVLHKYPKGDVKLNRTTVIIGWTLMSIMAFIIVFCLFPFNQLGGAGEIPADDMSLTVSVIYGSLNRCLWAIWISWIILVCHWGYGGVVNSVLSYPALQPFSRLTYCIFIMSLGIQSMVVYSQKRLPYFSNFLKFEETCGLLVVILFASLLLNLIVESPIVRLEKIIMGGGAKRKENGQNGVENRSYKEEKDEETPKEGK